MELLSKALGEYAYNFVLLTTPVPALFFSAFLFSRDMTKRKHFTLRLMLVFFLLIAMHIGLAVLRTRHESIYTRIIAYIGTYLSFVPLLIICFSDSAANVLLCWCAAVATSDISNRIFTLIIIALGKNSAETISLFSDFVEFRDWTIYFLLRFAFCTVLYLIFRRAKCLEADKNSIRNITGLSVFFASWMVLYQAFSRQYMQESAMLYTLITVTSAIFSFAVLILRTGILSQNQYRHEIAMTEKLLREERKQYESIKENIEIVNMRCHDLKHQLEDLSCKLTEEEMKKLRDAVRIYDSSMKTGNEVLDVVIYEKQLVFVAEGIRFTCMADGSLLSFMRTTHIYALFNNALGNALEAVRKLKNLEKRIIDLSVKQSGGSVEIIVTNYFDGILKENNMTTKDDKNRHGIGMKSMKYIVSQYGGTLSASAEGEVFELKCRVPAPKK